MYTTFTKQGSDLRIALTDEGKTEVKDHIVQRDDPSYRGTDEETFSYLIEDQLGMGWEYITPAEIGALTSNPYLLADDVERNDQGDLVRVGTVYAFNDYQLRDPLEDLERQGYVIFHGYT